MNSNAAHIDHSPGSGRLDWGQAMRVATVRLNEQDVLSDGMGHVPPAGEAEWLAALLCAYGKLAEERDRR